MISNYSIWPISSQIEPNPTDTKMIEFQLDTEIDMSFSQ